MSKATKTWEQPKLTALSVTETLTSVSTGSTETMITTAAGSTISGRCCS